LKIRNTAFGLQKQPLGELHSNSNETTTTEDKKNISDPPKHTQERLTKNLIKYIISTDLIKRI
jgi:hypothetical protein